MKKFLNEFKTFISRGNVMDMAIGVVIATAFGKISASLVADIIMPLIGCLIGCKIYSSSYSSFKFLHERIRAYNTFVLARFIINQSCIY